MTGIQPEEVSRKSRGNRTEGDHASFCLLWKYGRAKMREECLVEDNAFSRPQEVERDPAELVGGQSKPEWGC